MISNEVEKRLEAEVGLKILVTLSSEPADPGTLTRAEAEKLKVFRSEKRRADWLKGRAALKKLLTRLGKNSDTSLLAFPNNVCSLAHSHGMAVAVGVEADGVAGVGVDLEIGRKMNPNAARFYLTQSELRGLQEKNPDPEILLRLWTVKEALYKANPRNSGTVLADYALEDPSAASGAARFRDDLSFSMRYSVLTIENGFLSAAISAPRAD